MSIRSLIQPSSMLMAKLGNEPAIHNRIQRIAKEFEIFEYFYDHPPNVIYDKDWEHMLRLRSTYERVHFWRFLSKSNLRRMKDEERDQKQKDFYRTYVDEQVQKFEAGGMGYCRHLHTIYVSGWEEKYGAYERAASSYMVGDMPQIAFDMQFVTQGKAHVQSQLIDQLDKTLGANLKILRRPFPIDIVNADLNDPTMARLFRKELLLTKPNALDYPGIKPYNPHQSTSDTDPSQQVVYLSRHAHEMLDGPLIHKAYIIPFTFDQNKETLQAPYTGRYRMMSLPTDRYLKMQGGAKYIPFVQALKVLGEVANGEKWGKALINNIPIRRLIPPEERPPEMQYLYDKRREGMKKDREMTQIILDSLGPENGINSGGKGVVKSNY